MKRRGAFLGVLLLITATFSGNALVHGATCTPLEKGTCRACKNCSSCKHCSKNGGKCSVCA